MRTFSIRLIGLCFSLLASPLFAQVDSSLVLKGAEQAIGIEQVEMIDQLMLVMPGYSGSKDLLNEQSVKAYLMPARTAGFVGSADCYALAACLEYYANFQNNYKINLSPDYIFLNLDQNNMVEALTFLIQHGTVSAAIVPYNSTLIPPGVRNTARFPIENYLHLYRKSTNRMQKIFQTRKALMRGNPVIVQMKVPAEMPSWKNTRLWEDSEEPADRLQPFLVVGYEEQEEVFELLGVWGPGWAHNGYIEVKYDDFARWVENGFVLVPMDQYDTEGR